MPRQKRASRILKKAEFRVAGLKAIDPNIAFDDKCNLQNLTQTIEEFRNVLEAYNTDLAAVDSCKIKVDAMEKTLGSLSDKMLMGVCFRYGRDSNEYDMAGGVRESERIRKRRLTRMKNNTAQAPEKNPQ
jgi:hypothetical protein